MTGTAIGVLVASQSDLNLAGVGREQQMALYAAEYSVARAKGFIASQTVAMFNAVNGWNGFLQSPDPTVQAVFCLQTNSPASQPGTTVKTSWVPVPAVLYTMTDHSGAVITGQDVKWSYCIHNNAEDPGYLAPATAGVFTGDTDDSRDPQHLLTIEGYGWAPNNAYVHLSVNVGVPTLNTTGGTQSYAQEGSGAAHTGASGTADTGVAVTNTAAPVKF
ncbi:MAG: hypothetical protein ABI321_15990 [Polyangia bacterium]